MRNKAAVGDDEKEAQKTEIISQRVPTIRLKLKISRSKETESEGTETGRNGSVLNKSDGTESIRTEFEPCGSVPKESNLNNHNTNESNTTGSNTNESNMNESNLNESNTTPSPVSVSQSHTATQSKLASHSNCGTFKYRPFKLFPLLAPSSRYRVLVTRFHTDTALNPAIRLNYLWATTASDGVYTDDSDLVCVAIRDGWCRAEDIKGKELMIEVEVVNGHGPTGTPVDPHANAPEASTITPRIYPFPHDGHHIRILAVTLNPSSVHLKRWRKQKRRNRSKDPVIAELLTTPKFKTGNGLV